MPALMPWLALLLHAGLLATAAPALDDVLRQVAARWNGLPPPPAGQAWRDLVRLWRKPGLAAPGAWFLFTAAPPVALGAAAAAALAVPSFTAAMGTSASADLITVAALLALSRLAPAVAAFQTATPSAAYVGLQSATARLPAEPILLLVALVLALQTGTTHVDVAPLREGWAATHLPGLLAALALVAWAGTEPAAPALFNGRDQALLLAAAQLRRVAALSLAATVGLPFGLAQAGAGLDAWIVGACCWSLKLAGLAILGMPLAPHRIVLPLAALLALLAAVIVGVQGRT